MRPRGIPSSSRCRPHFAKYPHIRRGQEKCSRVFSTAVIRNPGRSVGRSVVLARTVSCREINSRVARNCEDSAAIRSCVRNHVTIMLRYIALSYINRGYSSRCLTRVGLTRLSKCRISSFRYERTGESRSSPINQFILSKGLYTRGKAMTRELLFYTLARLNIYDRIVYASEIYKKDRSCAKQRMEMITLYTKQF